MAISSISFAPSASVVTKATAATTTSSSSSKNFIGSNCTCGARAYLENKQRERARQVAPVAIANVMLLRISERHSAPELDKHDEDSDDEDNALPVRKRSLWRKLLGKGPKCICTTRVSQPPAPKVTLIRIPSEYVGCSSVRVAGKRVPYTREMQLRKRSSYTPMDAISEEDDRLLDA